MEQVREVKFTFYRDTNKETTAREFTSLPDLLDFLADRDENRETILQVMNWIEERGE